jgi:integrase/recombinase XerC
MNIAAADDWTGRYLRELATQRKLSAHTIAAYGRDLAELARLAGHTDWPTLTHFDIRRFAAKLHADGQSPTSIARKLSGWRGFFEWLSHQTALAANPVDGVRAPRRAKRLPKALAVDDAVKLMDSKVHGHPEPAELCDRAMFELLYSSGLRVSELAGLDVRYAAAQDAQAASLGWLELEAQEVVVTGKGNKMRRSGCRSALRRALRCRPGWQSARPRATAARRCFCRCAAPGSARAWCKRD